MLTFRLGATEPPVTEVLFLGAHPDDLEIGCGATVSQLVAGDRGLRVTWAVLSGTGVRAREARESARTLLDGVRDKRVLVQRFRDGFFPSQAAAIKRWFERLKPAVRPGLIFTPFREDLHQDHRLVAELTWQTFRDHTILEYEIPKYDGDLGRPNVFVPLDEAGCERKIRHVLQAFPSQKNRAWFSADVFRSILRLRGVEANAPHGYAEAFHCRKLRLAR
jgi:LmbE family N-acetylglucosaminyl deacetylase